MKDLISSITHASNYEPIYVGFICVLLLLLISQKNTDYSAALQLLTQLVYYFFKGHRGNSYSDQAAAYMGLSKQLYNSQLNLCPSVWYRCAIGSRTTWLVCRYERLSDSLNSRPGASLPIFKHCLTMLGFKPIVIVQEKTKIK